mmetsp:Transcript_3742/g.5663  ORF Transcript_3742/g.5663 Transcript_3742/m.5663 type:complete len:107 (+) Transcript_3742:67-387(+)
MPLPPLQKMKILFYQIVQSMLGYCAMSRHDIALLNGADGDKDDYNTFLVNFLETEEDQLNQVSIRLSMAEFIEEVGLLDDSYLSMVGEGPTSNNSADFTQLISLLF